MILVLCVTVEAFMPIILTACVIPFRVQRSVVSALVALFDRSMKTV